MQHLQPFYLSIRKSLYVAVQCESGNWSGSGCYIILSAYKSNLDNIYFTFLRYGLYMFNNSWW